MIPASPSACPDRGGATEPSPDLTPVGAWRRCGEAKARIEETLARRSRHSPQGDGGWPPLRPPAVRPLNPEEGP